MPTTTSSPRLEPQGVVENAVRVQCVASGSLDDHIELFVEGILIGELRIAGRLSAGETVDVPVLQFPQVSLPAAIRYKANRGTFAPEAETLIRTVDDVYRLAGKGEVKSEGYVVEDGSIVLFLSNLSNGFWVPNAYGRFNNGLTRPATVEQLRQRDEGGCRAKLRLALHGSDLHRGGLKVEIFCADRDGPVETIEYRPLDPIGLAADIARLEGEVQSQYGTQLLRLTSLERELKSRMAALETRVETFLEYALALTMDRLATRDEGGPARLDAMSDPSKAAEIRHLMTEIRHEVAFTRAETASPRNVGGRRIIVQADSDAYFEGWNYPEQDNESVAFRWMQRRGRIRLPCLETEFGQAVVKVGICYKGEAPSIHAHVNGRAASVHCFPIASSGGYEVKITPNGPPIESGGRTDCVLTLESANWGSPIEDGRGQDSRILSVMVRQVEVFVAPDGRSG